MVELQVRKIESGKRQAGRDMGLSVCAKASIILMKKASGAVLFSTWNFSTQYGFEVEGRGKV